METLPVEIVTYIAQMLSPIDLARCSAASRRWRDILNQDTLWQPLCDPQLVDPLQTTPFFTPPPFQSPETEDSTLSPLCHWRLVFMRENHLWNNWRRFSNIEYRKILPDCFLGDCRRIDFLTDSLILVFRQEEIGILNVKQVPAALVAKSSDESIIADLKNCKYEFRTIKKSVKDAEDGTSDTIAAKILVLQKLNLVVYDVDAVKRSIHERESISLGSVKAHKITQDFYIGLSVDSLMIFDLKTGKTTKEEPLPVEATKNGVNEYEIRSSPSHDFIIVCFTLRINIDKKLKKCYIFDLKKLSFLPGPICENENNVSFTINGQYLAAFDETNLSIYNCFTRELVLHQTRTSADLEPTAFNNAFIISDHEVLDIVVKLFFPSSGTIITLWKQFYNPVEKFRDTYKCITFHDRFIAFVNHVEHQVKGLWTVTGVTVKQFQIEYLCKCIPFGYISPSFTKVICRVENKNTPKYVRQFYSRPHTRCFNGIPDPFEHINDSIYSPIVEPQMSMFPKWYIKHLW